MSTSSGSLARAARTTAPLFPRRRNLDRRIVPHALLAAALAAPLQQAHADTWNCVSHYWDVASCWADGTIPTPADTAIVRPAGVGDTLLRIDDTTFTTIGAATALYLEVDAPGGSIAGVSQEGGTLDTGSEIIGFDRIGEFSQTGGTHITDSMTLGFRATGHGSYTLSGIASLLARYSMEVGNAGE
jgi:hypothetical protein